MQMLSATEKQTALGLLVLRVFLGIFLLQWSIEKLLLPSATARIAQNFYGLALPDIAPYLLGVAELTLSIGLLLGAYRTLSYGLPLLIHTVSVAVSWRQLMDPFGLAKVGGHLWIAAWPTWGAFAALFIMRRFDAYTIDGKFSRGGAVS
jgi:putative oxidoreductase